VASICGSAEGVDDREDGVRGQFLRKELAKQESSESRMQTAKAMVLSGRSARESRLCTSGTEGLVREVEEGMRFVRWVAGPARDISLSLRRRSGSRTREATIPKSCGSTISPEQRKSGECGRVVLEDVSGGVGKFESGTYVL